MAYRSYRRRRRKRRTDWKQFNARKRKEVSARYGGIDHDVRQVFFSLPPSVLAAVFQDYQTQYGSSACSYARETYGKWRTSQVEMSGQVSERLLAIVPVYLDFGTKYDLLDKLWRQRQGKRIRIEITADANIQAAIQQVTRAIENGKPARLPDYIVQRLNWLTKNDGLAAQALLDQVLTRESEIIATAVGAKLRQLFRLCSDLVDNSATILGERVIHVPGAIVEVVVTNRKSTGNTWRNGMTNEARSETTPSGRNLVPINKADQRPACIQNTQNVLDEAIKRMSPDKQQELLDKAAEEAIRIQVKRKEHEGDREAVEDKIREAERFVRGIAGKPGVSGTFESDQRSPDGDTKITVSSRSGFCFVATACFADYDHPTVVELRRFRDLVLMESALGRRFISAYCRYGPVLARWVNRLPALKPALRCALSVFADIHSRRKTKER